MDGKIITEVVKAHVAASNWYRNLTCGSSKLGSSKRSHPGNRDDQRAKLSEDLWRCVCLHTRPHLSTHRLFRPPPQHPPPSPSLPQPPSRIGLVGRLRIHRTETGEPVPGARTHSRDHRLNCSHYLRAFTHRMGLFGHMRIHDSGIHRNADNTDTPCKPSATDTPTKMNDIRPASTDFSCPQCAHNFNSRIGLVGHLRIHR
ncbi:unnamed protein product [Schistocephalus solidus]|uniref:C2H2-type domain-containing protein n=1 Tax=Schistocephalus solidus TaxID=70667 RepID=A0A183S7J6_SCHSO|nr:unnamed protein product [Schistocephalus solidus]